MPLPIGDWEINVDGYEGTLSITNVDAQNKVTGILKLSSTHNVTGTWTRSIRSFPSPTNPTK
jgi:hypothetical protein